jgi:hypothetical protein
MSHSFHHRDAEALAAILEQHGSNVAADLSTLRASLETSLAELDDAKKQIRRLQSTVDVLVRALGRAGVIDATWTSYELQHEMDLIDPPPPPPPDPIEEGPVHPYRGAVRGPGAPAVVCERCVRCGDEVDKTTMSWTALGLVCTPCFEGIDR